LQGNYKVAAGKISGYRNNVRLETILSQAPNPDVKIRYGEGAETKW
jgi:hypothetical protein